MSDTKGDGRINQGRTLTCTCAGAMTGGGNCWTNSLFLGTLTGAPVGGGGVYPSLVGLRAVSDPFTYRAARLYAYEALSTGGRVTEGRQRSTDSEHQIL